MTWLTAALLVTCCLLIGTDAGRHARLRLRHSRNAPQRCVQHSETAVSCASANSSDALVPHPDDCRLFYYCDQPNQRPLCRQCPHNLHFNPVSHVCDWPEQAGCANSFTNSTESIPSAAESGSNSTSAPISTTENSTPPESSNSSVLYVASEWNSTETSSN